MIESKKILDRMIDNYPDSYDEKRLDDLVLEDKEGVAEYIMLSLHHMINDPDYDKLTFIIRVVQEYYPFENYREKEFFEVILDLLLVLNDKLDKNISSHSVTYFIMDLVFHNTSLFDDLSIKEQDKIGRVISLFADYRYNISHHQLDDIYLAVHFSVNILGYLDEKIYEKYTDKFKNHFDLRIREEYYDLFEDE
jgi:hypothetical protein